MPFVNSNLTATRTNESYFYSVQKEKQKYLWSLYGKNEIARKLVLSKKEQEQRQALHDLSYVGCLEQSISRKEQNSTFERHRTGRCGKC